MNNELYSALEILKKLLLRKRQEFDPTPAGGMTVDQINCAEQKLEDIQDAIDTLEGLLS